MINDMCKDCKAYTTVLSQKDDLIKELMLEIESLNQRLVELAEAQCDKDVRICEAIKGDGK